MDERNAKLIVTKDGRGVQGFRMTLPTKWVREMGGSAEDRELDIKFDGETIYVTKKKESNN